MSRAAHSPPPPPPPRPETWTGGRVGRVERFLREVTAGVDGRELRGLVDRDAPRVYSVLTRDRREPRPAEGRLRRLAWDARILFLSLSEKLTPGRRVLFLASLVAALVGLFDLEVDLAAGGRSIIVDASPLPFLFAVGGLLFLLASELVDRVLVRDEIEVARALQRGLLPRATPAMPGWGMAFSVRNANDIGGDYVRFEPLDDGRLGLAVADASGHGIAAGLLMAIADTALRIGFSHRPDPAVAADFLHRAVLQAGDRHAFVTAFVAVLDPATGTLDYVGAGHPSPLVRRRDGTIEEPLPGSLPAGLRERFAPVGGRLVLAPGESLVVTTDGLFEGLSPAGEPLGWERLRGAVAGGGDARALHDRLRALHTAHVAEAPLSDDCTIVVLGRDPGPR